METNKGKGGRPRDEVVDSHIEIGKNKNGKPIKICKFCRHTFSIGTSSTRIRFHLAKVENQGVKCCTKVPPEVVEELAMSSSSSKRPNANIPTSGSPPPPQTTHSAQEQCEMDISIPPPPQRINSLLCSIPSNGDMQQPSSQGCYTLGPPPPMQSATEQCPRLLDGSLQQSNVDMDVQLNPLLQDDIQQPPPQRCCASGLPPPQIMQLDVPMQQFNGVQSDPSGMGIGVLGHQSPIEMPNLSEDSDQFLSTRWNDPECFVNQMALNTLQSNESCSMQLVSPHQWMDSMHDTSIAQDMVRGLLHEVHEMPPYNPQHNGSRSTHSTLASQLPRQQHPREDHNHLPDQELPQDAAGMDSAHDATTPQNLLQGGSCLTSGGPPPPQATHSAQEQCEMDISNPPPPQRINSLVCSIPSNSDMQQPSSQECCTSGPLPSQTMQSAQEQCPRLLDGSLQQSDVILTYLDVHQQEMETVAPPSGKEIPMATKFQGPTFNRKVKEIYASLQHDSMSKIGLYGMGGSGKTTIMKYIHNLLLKGYFMPFTHVMWVTVSQDHTIPKLQRHLASKLDITLPHDEDQDAWAATLYEKMLDMCYVLILDDVWDEINLEEVGIPEPSQENRCKLILTTRWLDVCYKMNCKQPIFLDLLSQDEAWELFLKTLNVTPEDSIIQGIMKEVAKECARLPLAIVTVAGSMKHIHDICEWRFALNSLRSRTYGFTDMAKKVIEVLKFSYYRLSEQLQQCLLFCALFSEDYPFKRKKLIKMLIMEGHIRSDKSLKSAYDEGHTIVNKLENACLLTKFSHVYHDRLVIHDLIRDMCLDIMGGRFLVKCSSKFPPKESEYTEHLEKVSLMGSKFEEIPVNMAPNCLKLSTLLLSECFYLSRISDSFFTNFPGLKVLNLSWTPIEELPSSVTNLVSLNALVLRKCEKLRRLPCLAPLKALKQLDLYRSKIEEAPKGLEELVNLTYLDLDCTCIERGLSSILTNLVKLQYLKLPDGIKIMMKDVKELKNLEVFKAFFANWEEFSEYVNSGRGPSEYKIKAELTYVGTSCASMAYNIYMDKEEGTIGAELFLREDHNTTGENLLSSEVIGQIPSPEIVQDLLLRGLHYGETRENGELKGIFNATGLFPFSNLVNLKVEDLASTEDLISASSQVVEFSSSPTVLPCFQNLQVLIIEYCSSLESILGPTANPTEEEGSNPISFPNLCILKLQSLPKLRSIYGSILICPSIEYIGVYQCSKLKRLPLQLPPVLDNNNNNNSGQLSSPPPLSSLKEINGESEWWESLEWDQLYAKALLQPYFKPRPWVETIGRYEFRYRISKSNRGSQNNSG